MDINKVQKLNQMAMNLQRHNIVMDKESAIKNASQIYGQQHNFSQESVVYPTDTNTEDYSKDIRKLTFALRDVLLEIRELKSHVFKLDKELNDLRVNQVRRPPKRDFVDAPKIFKTPEQEVENNQNAAKIAVSNNSSESKPVNPIDRNGIAPSDVAIDKFFYYGQN